MSYRYAWGLIQQATHLFNAPLIEMTRGKGSRLTALGQKLVWAERRVLARLEPILDGLASEITREIDSVLNNTTSSLKIQASHCFAVELLCKRLQAQQQSVDIHYCGSLDALSSLTNGLCDVAGFHLPVGESGLDIQIKGGPQLNAEEHLVLVLALRQQGLMIQPGNPKKIYRLKDLTARDTRFVHRQLGSGTRFLFDELLENAGIDPCSLMESGTPEYTHAAVAAYVASGMADAGFGVETAARRFNLEFIPLAAEHYFLAINKARMKNAQLQILLNMIRSALFKESLEALPGYDALETGRIVLG
jgi:molybdate-binding protein